MNARRVQVSDFVARGMWGSAGWRGVVRGEVTVQDDRGGAECGGVDTACREPDDDRMHGAEVGQFGHFCVGSLTGSRRRGERSLDRRATPHQDQVSSPGRELPPRCGRPQFRRAQRLREHRLGPIGQSVVHCADPDLCSSHLGPVGSADHHDVSGDVEAHPDGIQIFVV